MSGRPWTKREDATLRRLHGRLVAREIAARLGRSVSSVHNHIFTRGFAAQKTPPVSPREQRTIFRMAAAGYCNRCIGRKINRERHTVADWRKKLGARPIESGGSVGTCRTCVDKIRSTTREQCRKAGVRSLGEVRALAFREYAASQGWPADLRPRAVQILNLLWQHGPQSRRQIADATGMPWKGSRKSLVSNDPEGSYLAHLIARGQVVSLGRIVRGVGRGHSTQLYSIAPGVAPKQQTA